MEISELCTQTEGKELIHIWMKPQVLKMDPFTRSLGNQPVEFKYCPCFLPTCTVRSQRRRRRGVSLVCLQSLFYKFFPRSSLVCQASRGSSAARPSVSNHFLPHVLM